MNAISVSRGFTSCCNVKNQIDCYYSNQIIYFHNIKNSFNQYYQWIKLIIYSLWSCPCFFFFYLFPINLSMLVWTWLHYAFCLYSRSNLSWGWLTYSSLFSLQYIWMFLRWILFALYLFLFAPFILSFNKNIFLKG